MSDPIEKLDKTCDLLGDECRDLIKARKDKQIGDITFVNEYFMLVEKMPNEVNRENILTKLEDYINKENKLGDTDWLK